MQNGVLIFEYDRDGFLIHASGSCLGAEDPSLEIRAGIVAPEDVRRALAGEVVTQVHAIGGRLLIVRHRPIRGADGSIRSVRCAAVDASAVSLVTTEPLAVLN